jgi:hypothetical protein
MKDIVNLKKEAEVSQKKVRELESEKSKLNAVSSFTIIPDPQITWLALKPLNSHSFDHLKVATCFGFNSRSLVSHQRVTL